MRCSEAAKVFMCWKKLLRVCVTFNLLYEKRREEQRKGGKEKGRRGKGKRARRGKRGREEGEDREEERREETGRERERRGRRRRVEKDHSRVGAVVLCATYSIREGWFCDLIVQ